MAGIDLSAVAAGARAVRPSTAEAGRHVALLDQAAAAGLAGEWRRLADHAAEDNAFFHPDFALAAALHLGEAPRFAAVRDGAGRLVALSPVVQSRLGRIAPALRTWSHDYAPLGVPLVDPKGLGATVAALLEGTAGRASLIAADLPLDGPVAAAFVAAARASRRPVDIVGAHVRAALIRPPGGTDCRTRLPSRRRKEYARQMRRLAELGPVKVETTIDRDGVSARFEEFLMLEAAGWKGRAGTALAATAATAAFAREIVFERSQSGAVRIDSIRVGAHAVAMLVSFVAGATAYTWKIAYDEAYRRFSPGAQLMLEAPRGLFSDPRVERIDSCAAADHPMIDHLWKDRLDVGTLVIGPPGGGAVHSLGLAAFKAEIEARHAARRLQARFAGR